MTLDNVKSAYQDLSAKASDIVRQLSLSAIAIVWLFRDGTDKAPAINGNLATGAFWAVVTLALDLTQYIVGSFTWFVFYRYKERQRTSNDANFVAPEWFNWPTWILFALKVVALATAYAQILPFLYSKIVH